MPSGGTLSIQLANVELAENEHENLPRGSYVRMRVADTGIGMDAATRARIFEPFFTTKEVGKGTGLGLATVHGIIQQSGGAIEVDTAPNRGTTFDVYLPRTSQLQPPRAAPEPEAPDGTETVLLVEDDAQVRAVARAILRKQGYRVLDAENAREATMMAEQHKDPIHLLVTDVVMPKVSGKVLADRIRAARPDMRVLFMSGYTAHRLDEHDMRDFRTAFLQKPFTAETLARKVRQLLDSTRPPEPAL